MKHRFLCAIALYVVTVIMHVAPVVRAEEEVDVLPDVLVSALRVHSTKEFVEVTNNSNDSIDVTGWKGVYHNASGGNVRTLFILDGELEAHKSLVFASSDYSMADNTTVLLPLLYSGLADAGGFVKLYMPVEVSADFPDGFRLIWELGWTTSTPQSPEIVKISGAYSIKRCVDGSGNYRLDRDAQDYIIMEVDRVSVSGTLCPDLESSEDTEANQDQPVEDGGTTGPIDGPENSCAGIVISEIMPNPAGSDTDKEFIELYNTTSNSVNMKGCAIEVQGTTHRYAFDAIDIPPLSFYVLTGMSNDLVLANSAGGTVVLIDNSTEIHTVTYPADLGDDESWSSSGDAFEMSVIPTPGAVNTILKQKPCESGWERNQETGRCNKIPVETTLVCQEGYVLNASTNRCNKVSSTTVSACPIGQERNPETGRCRTIVSSASLVPCPVGQERNPLTNRCRTIANNTSLAPCKEGQERNPLTNRCRTIVLASTSDETESVIMDVEVPAHNSQQVLGIAFIVAIAVAYSVYEWRYELIEAIKKLRGVRYFVFKGGE